MLEPDRKWKKIITGDGAWGTGSPLIFPTLREKIGVYVGTITVGNTNGGKYESVDP